MNILPEHFWRVLQGNNIPLLGNDGRRQPPDLKNDITILEGKLKNYSRHSNGGAADISGLHVSKNVNGCKNINEFHFLEQVNESKTSYVAKVEDEVSGEEYVLKRLKYSKKDPSFGMKVVSIREVAILAQLKHPSIVALEDIAVDRLNYKRNYMLLEYCSQGNLTQLFEKINPLNESEIKCLLKMLLSGVAYLHRNSIMHRDLSPNNILVHGSGMLKIGDFGKARICTNVVDDENFKIGTPGHRAPEIVLGSKSYERSVDIWSVGTIFAFMLLHKPLFSANSSDINQMNDIIELLGVPKNNEFNFNNHKYVQKKFLKRNKDDRFRIVFQTQSDMVIDFIKSFLTYDPDQRLEAEEYIKHKYIVAPPLALESSQILMRINSKRKERIPGAMPELGKSTSGLETRCIPYFPETESLSEGEIPENSSASNSGSEKNSRRHRRT